MIETHPFRVVSCYFDPSERGWFIKKENCSSKEVEEEFFIVVDTDKEQLYFRLGDSLSDAYYMMDEEEVHINMDTK